MSIALMTEAPFSYREKSKRAAALRARVYQRSSDKCVYCCRALVEQGCTYTDPIRSIDHDLPRARGGTDAEDNLVACCTPCNTQKRSLTGAEYRAWREARGL